MLCLVHSIESDIQLSQLTNNKIKYTKKLTIGQERTIRYRLSELI